MQIEPKPICHRIGVLVKDRRKELGLSLDKLADRTDLSKAYLHQIEHGQSEPGAGTIVRLCRALRLSADEFLRVGEER